MKLARLPFLVMILLAGAAVAEPDVDTTRIPIPEQRTAYGWSESQRIQFKNMPLMRKAQAAIKAGDTKSAQAALEQVLANDPGNNHARVFLVNLYDVNGQPDKAIAMCDDLAAAYPEYLEPQLTKGYIAFRLGRRDLAISTFETVLARAPADFPRRQDIVHNLAQLYFLTGQYDQARKYGDEWLNHDKGLEPRAFLAECAIKAGDWTSALAHLDLVLEQTPAGAERAEVQLKRGFVLGNAGRLEEADKALREAQGGILDKARRHEIEKQLGYNALKMNLPFVAANHFKACLLDEFDEDLARAYLDALSGSGQWELAQLEARNMLGRNLTPATREAILLVVLYSYQHEDDDNGFLNAALQTYKEFPKPRYLLEAAAAAQRLGRTGQAVDLYRQYLDKDFTGETAMNLYYLLRKTGQVDEGALLLDRVLAAKPEKKIADAAAYERAQIHRERGETDEYIRMMGELIAGSPESRFYHEYAVQLYGNGHYEEAAAMFIKSLEGENDPATRFRTCKTIADIQLVLKQSNEAKTWLLEAQKHGAPDLDWQLGMARADYQLEDFPAVVERLLPLTGQRDVFFLYLGFAFYRMGMPGLALLNLNQVAESDKLTPRERYNLFSNRAYLQFDQDQNEAALADLERALDYEYTPELALVKVKTLIRLGRFPEAVSAGEDLLKSQSSNPMTSEMVEMLKSTQDPKLQDEILSLVQQPDARLQADVCQHIGLAAYRGDQYELAVRYFSQALDLNPRLSDAHYLRGLAQFKRGDYDKAEKDFLAFYSAAETEDAVPDNFWGDLGVLEGDLKDYDLGTAALAHANQVYPYDIDSREESGYQNMKWNRNKAAQTNFQQAIDLYNVITPNLSGSNQTEYTENRQALKRENGFLDKQVGVQAYFGKTDFNNDIDTAVQTIDGALPSQAGVLASYRPPDIGFRNQKTLDVYGRVLANFENASSWALDEDTYQGGLGIVYKPLAAYNLNVSFERLFKIGDEAEENWLWRNLYSWERGEKPQTGKDYWWYSKLYGEVSYFLEHEQRWIYYLDGRLGLTLQLAPNLLLTIPQGLAIGRYQSNDDTGLGTYTMVGLGANVRLLEREKQYTIERWYLDAYGYYVWGWFDDQPEGLEDKAFEGVIFGVNFVK